MIVGVGIQNSLSSRVPGREYTVGGSRGREGLEYLVRGRGMECFVGEKEQGRVSLERGRVPDSVVGPNHTPRFRTPGTLTFSVFPTTSLIYFVRFNSEIISKTVYHLEVIYNRKE